MEWLGNEKFDVKLWKQGWSICGVVGGEQICLQALSLISDIETIFWNLLNFKGM